jgi:hypothetical protein
VQRLFSTFPGSWPGLGLLVLRVTLGLVPLVALAGPAAEWETAPSGLAWLLLCGLSACLLAGLATPATTPLYALGVGMVAADAGWPAWLALAGASVSLMLLGPGAWSLDALRYGRKRIDILED